MTIKMFGRENINTHNNIHSEWSEISTASIK